MIQKGVKYWYLVAQGQITFKMSQIKLGKADFKNICLSDPCKTGYEYHQTVHVLYETRKRESKDNDVFKQKITQINVKFEKHNKMSLKDCDLCRCKGRMK